MRVVPSDIEKGTTLRESKLSGYDQVATDLEAMSVDQILAAIAENPAFKAAMMKMMSLHKMELVRRQCYQLPVLETVGRYTRAVTRLFSGSVTLLTSLSTNIKR